MDHVDAVFARPPWFLTGLKGLGPNRITNFTACLRNSDLRPDFVPVWWRSNLHLRSTRRADKRTIALARRAGMPYSRGTPWHIASDVRISRAGAVLGRVAEMGPMGRYFQLRPMCAEAPTGR